MTIRGKFLNVELLTAFSPGALFGSMERDISYIYVKRRSGPTSQETHHSSATKVNQVMPLREIITVTICMGNMQKYFYFRLRDINSNHCALY
jgi:hypothetical protein